MDDERRKQLKQATIRANITNVNLMGIRRLKSINTTYQKLDFSNEWLSFQFMDNIYSAVKKINEKWNSIIRNIESYGDSVFQIGETTPPHISEGTGSSGGSSGGDEPSDPEKDKPQMPFTFGTLKLSDGAVGMTELGGVTTQLDSSGDYSVIGIEKKDGVYFYKILDKNNNTYYVEASFGTLTSDYIQILETSGETLVLKQPEVGEGTLERLTKSEEIFFVKDIVETESIKYAHVVDSTGKEYYIPESEITTYKQFTNLGKSEEQQPVETPIQEPVEESTEEPIQEPTEEPNEEETYESTEESNK